MASPSIPQNLTLQQGNGQVFITWNVVGSATSYTVQRSLDNSTWVTLATPIFAQFLDTTTVPNITYFYQVNAVNISGSSPYTASQNITPTISGDLTLGQIRLMTRQRADRVNSNFVTDSELNSYINQSYFELYDMLTTIYEDYYAAVPALIQSNGTSFQYTLPDGVTNFIDQNGNTFTPKPFYKLLGVDCGIALNDNAWVTLRQFDFVERNRFVYPNITSTFLGVFNLRYRVFGNTLYFIPTPSGGQFLRIWYIPRMVQLLQDSDVIDGVSGWTEYIIIDAAIKVLQKEESDVSVLMAQKEEMKNRINASAQNRDAGMGQTISDTRSPGTAWGGWGPNSDGSFGGY